MDHEINTRSCQDPFSRPDQLPRIRATATPRVGQQRQSADARHMEALFGHAYVEDLTRYSDGRFSTRHVERSRGQVDEWMNELEPGDARPNANSRCWPASAWRDGSATSTP